MPASQLSRRHFLKATGFMAAGAVLAACQPAAPVAETGAPAAAAPAAAQVELVGWTVHGFDPANEAHQPYRDAVMAHFNARYPNATFTYADMGWDEVLRQNLVTALMGGTAPDIIVGENYIQPYAEDGAFLPLDDVIADVKDDLVPGTHAAAVYGGKIYGISQITGCFAFERNPNVIEQAGLDPDIPPATWSELLEQAEQITRAGNGEYYGYTLQGPVGFLIGGILRFAVYHKTAGAELCKDDCTYPWFNNPASERVLTFLRELHRYTPPGLSFNPNEGEVYAQLFQGVSAYQIAGSWHVRWAKDSGLMNARYSQIPIPDEDGVQATGVVGNVILSVLTETDHPEEASYFVRCFAEDDVQDLVWPVFGRLPSKRSALERLKPQSEEANVMFIDMLLNADLGVLPQWRQDPQKIWTVYNDLITKLLTTEEPVLQLMDEAQTAVDAVMQTA
ncbi:MAG TPA: substrate-binding domain-containing protein [Caldilineaceae bacterium]|nr:substrate-binding domain-containing protein [Caldilineaceae bacterium]